MQNETHSKVKTTVAVVGMGYWGKNLVRNFYELGALSAICDSNQSVETSCKREYANVRFCREFGSILSDPTIAAVALATPAVTHYELARAACFCRKAAGN